MTDRPRVGGPASHLHRIEQIMGMPIIVDVHDPGVPAAALDRVFDWFRRVDAVFSTYRADSDVSRLNRGELELERCSPLVRRVVARCRQLRELTDGYFDHEAAASWDERIEAAPGITPVDPSGLVKGWAVDGAAEILEQGGARNYCVEAAGDMRLAGHPDGGGPWRVGIQHPHDQMAIAAVLQTDVRAAIATSATYARGQHIVDPHAAEAPRGLVSVTVIGEGELATADAYATAIFAMGPRGPQWAAEHIWPYSALMIDTSQNVFTTSGLRRWRAAT